MIKRNINKNITTAIYVLDMSSKLIIKPSQCYSVIFTDNYKQCKCTDLVFLFLALDMFTPADPAKLYHEKSQQQKY